MENEIKIMDFVEYALQQGNIKPSDVIKIMSMKNEMQMKKYFAKVFNNDK